ncbi:hypothetical protein [Burkholderia multivorans]|uniref:hypothetical protein n=1 Tax=Burkholderia multivorans TaxID=87883 RepID=UPI00201979CB|nr:hypothetical protein [Burkholderia multivorans]MCL4628529.1 hypothetical protein [Burkholderia multivorans]MCO1389975.1 hypothetical protein [Burkholderia multivorans]MDN7432113.1 hypothetical protein [Burkholderia multivorans]UQO13856.1 hypothetical protein L0Z40_25480 [Burkholderia multivorans]UQO54516.1 hypothetical protein L0Z30_01200 [Burkholderia multivorans]
MLNAVRLTASCLALLAIGACGNSSTVVGNNADEIRLYQDQRDNARRFREAVVSSMNQTTGLMLKVLSSPDTFNQADAAALQIGLQSIRLAGQAEQLFGKPMTEPLGWCAMLGTSAGQAIEESIRALSDRDRKQWAEKSIKAYQNTVADCDRQLQNAPKPQVFIQTAKDARPPRQSCEPEHLKQPEQGKALWRCADDDAKA